DAWGHAADARGPARTQSGVAAAADAPRPRTPHGARVVRRRSIDCRHRTGDAAPPSGPVLLRQRGTGVRIGSRRGIRSVGMTHVYRVYGRLLASDERLLEIAAAAGAPEWRFGVGPIEHEDAAWF